MMVYGKVSSVCSLAADHRETKSVTFGVVGTVIQNPLQIIHIRQGDDVIARVHVVDFAGDAA